MTRPTAGFVGMGDPSDPVVESVDDRGIGRRTPVVDRQKRAAIGRAKAVGMPVVFGWYADAGRQSKVL